MNRKIKWLIGIGLVCILCLIFSAWYSITFNESRLVAPTDFGSYSFRAKDLPMIFSIAALIVYVTGLFLALFRAVWRRKKYTEETNTTRKLNPKLGLLGFLGFLGFFGFLTYYVDGTIYPFTFFVFFGFFGFYYEGKMSGTFMDERFRENAARAQLAAFKITYAIMLAALIVLCRGKLFGSLEYTLITVMILLSAAAGLGIFLSEYLLYRYDHDEE